MMADRLKRYILADGFEFVTDQANLIVYSRRPGQRVYSRETLPIHVLGSVPEEFRAPRDVDLSAVSQSPLVGDYLVVKGEGAPPTSFFQPLVVVDVDFLLSE